MAHLLSPPGLPVYNGACEAGIGSLKSRAHHESARDDRAGEWACDDVEGARLMANEASRPGGFHAPTPNQQWRVRLLVSGADREKFLETVERKREEATRELACLPGMVFESRVRAVVDRRAIPRALVSHGILRVRRRRLTLPIYFARTEGIT